MHADEPQHPLRTVGRHADVAALDGFLAVPAGDSRVLVLEGEPGMGKTTLWHDGVGLARSRGWTVLSSQPTGAERSLSLSAVADLIGEVYDAVATDLPAPQATAIDELLLRRDPQVTTSPRAQAVAVLSIVERLAQRGPTLVAVDDVQWLDAASARLLAYLLRRLPNGAAALVTRRIEPYGSPPGLAVEELLSVVSDQADETRRLGPMSVGEVHALIEKARGISLARPLLTRLTTTAAGNPMLALETVTVLGPDLGSQPLSGSLPAPGGLGALVEGKVRGLSPACRELVLCAALMSVPHEAIVRSALGARIDVDGALEEAETAGVLVAVDEVLQFNHPLLASGAIAVATTKATRRLHEQLARLAPDSEERALHLVRAAREPSERAAAIIEDAARAQEDRGAVDSALALFEAAVGLTPRDHPVAVARRSLGEARAAHALEDTIRARVAVERGLATTATRAEALELLGELDFSDGDMVSSGRHFGEALGLVRDDEVSVARLHAQVARSVLLVDPHGAVEHASHVVDRYGSHEAVGPEVVAGALIDRFFANVMLGAPPALADLARGLALERAAGDEHPPHPIPMVWYHFTDDVPAARARFDRERRWAVESGWSRYLRDRLGHLAMVELRSGNWELAEEYAEESCSALSVRGSIGPVLMRFVWRSYVDIVRGRLERAHATLSEAAARFAGEGQDWWHAMTLSVLAFAEFDAGEHTAVDRTLQTKDVLLRRLGVTEAPLDRSEPFHVESLLTLGELDRAAEVLARLERRHRVFPRTWTGTALPPTRALVLAATTSLPEALAALQVAPGPVAPHEDDLPFETGMRRLVEARILRRMRSRAAAAAAFQQAEQAFRQAGADRWSARAVDEATRLGLRTARSAAGLTGAERKVAERAASGLTTREVAGELFMSPKTVEAHLSRVYRILGIRSRAELGSALASGDLSGNDS